MNLSVLQKKTAWILATWFGSGRSPKAPGTVGSLCSLPLILIGYTGGGFIFFLTILGLFFIGWWATHFVLEETKKQDRGFIVIDETVGQSLAFVLALSGPFHWSYVLIGFALFRFFDIVKIWPASFFDKSVHSAFGVMMDDVIAGIYAAVVLYGITFFIN